MGNWCYNPTYRPIHPVEDCLVGSSICTWTRCPPSNSSRSLKSCKFPSSTKGRVSRPPVVGVWCGVGNILVDLFGYAPVDGSEIRRLHQLKFVNIPIIYRSLCISRGWPWDFWTSSTVSVFFKIVLWEMLFQPFSSWSKFMESFGYPSTTSPPTKPPSNG